MPLGVAFYCWDIVRSSYLKLKAEEAEIMNFSYGKMQDPDVPLEQINWTVYECMMYFTLNKSHFSFTNLFGRLGDIHQNSSDFSLLVKTKYKNDEIMKN